MPTTARAARRAFLPASVLISITIFFLAATKSLSMWIPYGLKPCLILAAILTAATVTSCGKRDPVYPKKLSEWNIQNNPQAVAYQLQTPLFSDYADKERLVLLPANSKARFNEFAVYDFPVGTAIAKTFSYAGKRIETRVLYHDPQTKGWVGLPYVWSQDQSEAMLELVPDPILLERNQQKFEYTIPNSNQCKNCHENAGVMKPIGPKSRNLDAAATLRLTGVANQQPLDLATLDNRARAYLDINCAHCHNPKGPANTSGLDLSYHQTEAAKIGVCKTPVAAGQGSGGLLFSIIPGRPEESILMHRMKSTTPKVQMPELGRALVHAEGVALIREWIASQKGGCETASTSLDGHRDSLSE